MGHAVVMRGHLHGAHIDLERPVADLAGDVEVSIRRVPTRAGAPSSLLDLVATFPTGSRTKEDIDRQLADERDAWDTGG